MENILQKEFPNIRKHLPNIIDGPFYKGVVALADNSVILRIVALCTEANRGQMDRDLNREIKLICDKYDINIPFPQIVVNQPTVIKQASGVGEGTGAQVYRGTARTVCQHHDEDEEDR